MIVRSLMGLGLTFALMGMAHTPFQLLLCRLLQGAVGGISDAGTTFIGAEAPKDQQGKFLGRYQHAVAAGSLLGPLIGALVIPVWGIRPILFSLAGLTVLTALIAWIYLYETQSAKSRSNESKVFQAIMDLCKQRELTVYVIAGILVKCASFGLFAIVPLYLAEWIRPEQLSVSWMGVMQTAIAAGTLLGAPYWGRKNDGSKLEKNFTLAALGCGLSVMLQPMIYSTSWLVGLGFLQGFFYSALLQTMMLHIIRTADSGNRGTRIGASNSLLMIGQLTGPLMTTTLGNFFSLEWIIVLMGLLFFSSGLIIWWYGRSRDWTVKQLPS